MLFFKDNQNDQYIKEHMIYTEQNAGHIEINAKWASQTQWNLEDESCFEIETSTLTLRKQWNFNQPQSTSDRDYCGECKGYCQAFTWSTVKYLCVSQTRYIGIWFQ